MGAKVNGRIVTLDSAVSTGDVIEILTSKNPDAGPSQDWLTFVTSTRTRNKIKAWFSKERREEAIEQGKDSLARAMRKQNLPIQRTLTPDTLGAVIAHFRYDDVSALYAAIGEGHISVQSVVEKLLASINTEQDAEAVDFIVPTSSPQRSMRSNDSGVLVRGAPDILVKLAKCCTPVPGDPISGFVTRGQGVSVHQADCHNVVSLQSEPERLIEVEWAPNSKGIYLVQIQIEALDRSGLLSDVTRVLTENHVNILSASVSTSQDRVAISKFVFEMSDPIHLDRLLSAVRRIASVYDVYRVSEG
jgi:GTP pyrophosphokinase